MNNEIFTLNITQVKSAIVSGVLTAILGAAGYIIGVGDVFAIDVHALTNVTALAFLTTVVSLVKSLLTTSQGNFIGAVKVITETK